MNVTCAIKDKANFEILSMGMFPAELVGLNLEMITETTCDFPKMVASIHHLYGYILLSGKKQLLHQLDLRY